MDNSVAIKAMVNSQLLLYQPMLAKKQRQAWHMFFHSFLLLSETHSNHSFIHAATRL